MSKSFFAFIISTLLKSSMSVSKFSISAFTLAFSMLDRFASCSLLWIMFWFSRIFSSFSLMSLFNPSLSEISFSNLLFNSYSCSFFHSRVFSSFSLSFISISKSCFKSSMFLRICLREIFERSSSFCLKDISELTFSVLLKEISSTSSLKVSYLCSMPESLLKFLSRWFLLFSSSKISFFKPLIFVWIFFICSFLPSISESFIKSDSLLKISEFIFPISPFNFSTLFFISLSSLSLFFISCLNLPSFSLISWFTKFACSLVTFDLQTGQISIFEIVFFNSSCFLISYSLV